MTFHVPELYRVRTGWYASTAADGNNGAFDLPPVEGYRRLAVIASDGGAWEHVSVHAYADAGRRQWTPSWREMCHLKDLFWDPEDVVVQYHPRQSDYVNCHEHCLHLWRPVGVELPTPDPILVGPRAEPRDAR
jgi:hypothetical protein